VSYSVDVNILLYASDQTSPRHAAAIKFIESRALDPELCCIAWTTLMSYLRISTHPSIFAHPLSPPEALANIEELMSWPRVRVLSEEDGFLKVYREVSRHFAVRGNLIPDAHLAAILQQHDVRTLYTTDMDFRKFKFLNVKDPLA